MCKKMYKEENNLTERILMYQKTGLGIDEIIHDLSTKIYKYPINKMRGKEDDAGDFYLYFFPILKRLIKKYKCNGIPFEHYFNSSLLWNLKSYFRNKKKINCAWHTGTCIDFWEIIPEHTTEDIYSGYNYNSKYNCSKNIPEYNSDYDQKYNLKLNFLEKSYLNVRVKKIFKIEEDGKIKNPAARKRLILLTLRYAHCLSYSKVSLIAEITGYNREWVQRKVDNMNAVLLDKENRLKLLRERRNRAFYKCRLLEQALSLEEKDKEKQKCLLHKISKIKRRMINAVEAISRVPLFSTYRNIAEELGMPKGTVDTGLRWFKKIL